MSARVAELDLGDDATLERLLALQRASYAVEAELIGLEVLPPVLDTALDQLASTNPHVDVVPMPLTHLEPAWDAIDEVVPPATDRVLPGVDAHPQRPARQDVDGAARAAPASLGPCHSEPS